MILFPNGIQGLSDTKWQGVAGSANRVVGIDYRSEPGLIKVQQALAKHSGTTVDEFCKLSIPVSDGSNLWFSSVSGKIWREVAGVYTLISTIEIKNFDIRTAEDTGKSFDISSQVPDPRSSVMKPDGTKYYILNAGGAIFEYDLSTAFDISTAVYNSKTFTADIQSLGIFIDASGTRLFISEGGGSTSVIEYILSTAWDISSASASSKTYDFVAQLSQGYSVQFKEDGLKMYVCDGSGEDINEYTLSVAWDITTATYINVSIGLGNIIYGGAYISSDGLKLFSNTSTDNGTIIEYEFGTAWDISTLTATGNTYNQSDSKNFGITFTQDGSNFYTATQSGGSDATTYQYSLALDEEVITLGCEEFGVADGIDNAIVNYIYFATKNWLLRVPVSDIGTDWNLNYEFITSFFYGDDTYHPIQKQNNRLYVGDKQVILEVNEAGVVTLQSDFNVQAPERITTITDIDTDILVGTKDIKSCWVKRWDTESDSWYAQDEIFETEIYAFIRDDNYLYAQAGDFGRMYFYDGEKLLPDTRIPGTYSPTNRCKVNANAVANLFGIPVFGLSNIEGNPAWQGIYSYGRFSKNYNTSLDLSFPLSNNVFDDIEIGSIIVQGADMYASWKTPTSFGIDKIDWTVKYDSAFIESVMLVGAKDRSVFKAIKEITAEYFKLPTSTSVEFSVENNYQGFVDIEPTQKIDTKKYQVRGESTRKELGAVAVMIEFNVNANDCPEIENFNVKFEGEK